MTKYVTGIHGMFISIVECERETEDSIWIKGRSFRKRTSYQNYFNTREEAKLWLMNNVNDEIDRLERRLYEAKEQRGLILNLRKDT